MVLLGTSLIIYGTVTPTNENGPPVSSYSIDNGPASMYTAPTTNSSLFGLQFYGSRRLTADIHNLTITVESTKPSEYWLDYALVILFVLLTINSCLPRRIPADFR